MLDFIVFDNQDHGSTATERRLLNDFQSLKTEGRDTHVIHNMSRSQHIINKVLDFKKNQYTLSQGKIYIPQNVKLYRCEKSSTTESYFTFIRQSLVSRHFISSLNLQLIKSNCG